MYSYLCRGLRARERERETVLRTIIHMEEKRRRLVSREFASFLTAYKAPRTRPLLHSSRIVKVMAPKLVDGVRYFVSSSFLFDRRVLLDARCVTSL